MTNTYVKTFSTQMCKAFNDIRFVMAGEGQVDGIESDSMLISFPRQLCLCRFVYFTKYLHDHINRFLF